MNAQQIIVVGGGPAGFFAAITAAGRGARVILLERSARFLDKVRVSGGGRCNVTHDSPDARDLAAHYPRGGRALMTPLQKFSVPDTVEWFAARGVNLKTERDGRMFPVTDSSETIVNCLMNATQVAGVELRPNCEVERIARRPDGRFEVALTEHWSPAGISAQAGGTDGRKPGLQRPATLVCDRLLLATGGCRAGAAGQLAVSLGHTLEPPVPSLFAFRVESPWLPTLAGISMETVELSVPAARLRERGPLLVTHEGFSGPAVLRLSAWGARTLHGLDYRFPLQVNWLPDRDMEAITGELRTRRETSGSRLVANTPTAPLPARLWEQLVLAAGIARETRWPALSRGQAHALAQQLLRSEFSVTGKSLNRDEFVTCGGVRLSEVDFKTMQSRICPGLFFAGELLDIDGLTGGFNFQAAWTTGWLAGRAMTAP